MRFSIVKITGLFLFVGLFLLPAESSAFSLKDPEQTGSAISLGSNYDPNPRISFTQLSLMALYDYEQIMPHAAPDALRMKLEASFGGADIADSRVLASLNFFAFYYLTDLARGRFKPYVEAGAGFVYSDFQVAGQGLRINFNPQAGIGVEWQTTAGQRWYSAVRAHHLSNAGLARDNRGMNSLLYQLGCCF